jgi:hypothetical protein
VRRYIEEVWNRPNIDAVDELVSPEYLNHAASAEYQRFTVPFDTLKLCSKVTGHSVTPLQRLRSSLTTLR